MKTTNTIKNFAKRVVMALVAILMVSNAWGTDVTFTFSTDAGLSELGITKPASSAGTDLGTGPYSLSGVSMTATDGGTNTRVWNSGSATDLRIYKNGGTLTFTAPANITSIVLAGTTVGVFTANVGTFSAGTWTGNAASVTLTATNTGKINTITVTYSGSTTYTVTYADGGATSGSVPVDGSSPYSASATVTVLGNTGNLAKSGFNFNGWLGDNGVGAKTAGQTFSMPAANVTLTAQWSAVSYSNYRTLCSTTDPSLSVSPASLSELDYIVGSGPSEAKSFSMSGSNLTSGTLTVTAPTNFQVSKASGSGWASSITFTDVSGTLAATTVYVRLAPGKSAGEYSGNVAITGCGLASAVNVAVSGTVSTPTITATPNPVTGWQTAVGVAPSTTSVTVTGTNLKANISAALGGTNASDFSISTASITQTDGSASGTITITYTGAYNAVTTKTATLTLSSTDADDVVVNITFSVVVDPNLYFLTNLSDIHPKDKVIIVGSLYVSLGDEYEEDYALANATTTSTYPPDAVDVKAMISANKQTLSYSGTALQWNINYNSVSREFTINRDGDDDVFLYCRDDNKGLSVGTTGDYNVYNITSDYIKCKYLTRYLGVYNSDDWRTYGTNGGNIADQIFTFYAQPSTDPYVTLGANFSEFTYEYNHGPSTPQSFTVSGANLAANLVVTAPTNYEVCKTSDGTYTSSVEFTPSTGTVSEETVYIRLTAGLSVGEYDYAQSSGLSVTSGEADPVKTALEGSVTEETFTVTATSNNGSYGSVSPASQSTSTTATITATPESGFRVISGAGGYTVTSGTATVVNNGNNTFTVTPSTDCTVQINFEQIVVRTVLWNVNGNPYSTYTGAGTLSTSAEEGAKWSTLTLPDNPADNTLYAGCERTKFVGWSASPLYGDGNSAPSDLFKTTADDNADSHTISGNTTFYAVFAKGNGDGWQKVTSAPADWCGDYLLAYEASSSSVYVWNGTTDASNYVSATPDEGIITKPSGAVEITIEHFGETANYAIKVKEGTNKDKYFKGNSSNGFTLEDTQQNTTIGSVENIGFTFTNSSSYLRFNTTSGQTRFRYYKSTTATQSSYKTIALYQQASNYSDYATQCCTLKPVTNLAVSSTTANSVTLTWTAPSPTTGIDHLELRNASTDEKIGSNIAVGTTTTSVSELTECNTYSYKIVSVGAVCETPSDVVEATPFAGSETVTFNYNGGTGTPASFTTSCGGTSTILPTPTRDGYTFLGWWTESSAGSKVGDAEDAYTVSATTTIYAHWAQNFTVTYDLNGGAADPICSDGTYYVGQTVTVCSTTPTKTSSSFLGWKRLDTGATVAGGSTFTMPSNNVTIQAQWETVYFHIYYKEEDGTAIATDDVPQTAETTLRNQTPCVGYTFFGWSTSKITSETTTKPSIIGKGGASYTPTSDITVYPVYARSEGATTVKDTLTSTCVGSGSGYRSFTNFQHHSDAKYSGWATVGNSSIQMSDACGIVTTTSGGKLKHVTIKYNSKTGADRSVDLYGQNSNYSNVTAAMSTPTGTKIGTATKTTAVNYEQTFELPSSGSDFDTEYEDLAIKCTYGAAYVEQLVVTWGTGTYYYATHCETKTEVTVTYDANGGTTTCGDSEHKVTWAYKNGGADAPELENSQTICSDATRDGGYILRAWTTNADGTGTQYAPGATVTSLEDDIILYAQWDRVYTVTLYDNGVVRETLVEASAGAGVTLPSGNNCGAGSAFTFEGWTESAVKLNADPVRPATLHAAGAYAPTSDITLYSVYSRSVAGCEDFAAGVSGAYKMYNNTSDDYAKVTANANRYDKGNSGDAEIFYIAYAPAHSAYTIRTSLGYLGWSGAVGSETLTKNNATPYYWNITTNGTNWNFQPVGVSGKQFSGNGTYFNLHSNSPKYYIRLEKVAMTYYYNTAICEGSQITFHDGGGTISGAPTQPTGSSWNSGTHVLSGLEDCDKITTFPTANYDGWTFIGWSTEDYSNSGKHTADHPKENASTDEPDGSEIYKTGGNPYVVRGGSVDLYPIFTRFPENEPFNTETGGDYYIYYLKPGTDDGYGAPIRVYAGEYDGAQRYSQTTSCAAATEFTFTKSGEVWHIYDKATSKYVVGRSGKDDLQHANDLSGELDDWTITIKSGNQFYASCQGGGRFISFSTSANYFMDYSTTANPGICLPVYLGSCTERIYSSDPNPVPTIDLTGEPYVTSSAGERVRATATMTLSGSHLTSVPANKVKVSGTNLKFAKTATENPADYIMVEVDGSGNASATIYVYYTPVATEDGIDNIIVTAQAFNGSSSKDLKTTSTVHARHLPADFVIAAKWGDKWYALPNTCAGEGSNTAGVQIEVDNNDVPTAATAAPSTAKWGMRQTKKGSRSDGSYNDRLVFTERTTSTANDQKTLYNYNQAEVFTYATYTAYNNTNPERYEWIPVTTDFGDYELTNANNADHHLILRNSDGLFVAQNSDKSYDGKVRLLPATFYEEAPVQIVEWKENSVVVMYTGTETSATTKVGNSASASQELSTHKLTHGIYELTTGQSLASNDGKTLLLTFGSMKKAFEIPVIITGNSTAYSGHEKQDVVIVNGGKLSAAATKYSYRNIYVYGGGKLKIASGTDLGVNNIILRAGGISTSGIGSTPSATYDYVYPQVELRGTLSSTKTNIKYEYITDYDHWYHLVLPFDGTLSSITYPTEYYGDNVAAGNKGSWVIKRYAGAVRATGNYNAWVDIETENATSVTAGHGYIYWGAPKKVTINGDKQRQAWGIQRITMPITSAAAAMEAENADKTITGLSSYSEVAGNSGKVNDQGWNLIGNPYLTNLTGLNSESLITGKLVEELDPVTEKWTGRWVNNDDGVRYVTIPSEHFDTYEAQTMASFTTDNPMKTGCVFFVQIEDDATGVTFATAKRASLMPALFARTEQKIDVETGIVLSDESKHDEVNFWIKDGKTDAYEYNADYPKTMNTTNFNIYGVHSNGELSWVAISPEIAEGSMAIGYQVPAAGDYMLSLSETYVSDEIEHVFVTDHGVSPEVTTDLMEEDYNFYVNQAETNDVRFTVAFKLKEEDPGTTTNVENTAGVDSDKPLKFIYNDKMYILRNGIIYDAVGKKVSEIK